jgi:hypothetical protein
LDALHRSKVSRVELPVVDLHDDALAIGQARSVDAADARGEELVAGDGCPERLTPEAIETAA